MIAVTGAGTGKTPGGGGVVFSLLSHRVDDHSTRPAAPITASGPTRTVLRPAHPETVAGHTPPPALTCVERRTRPTAITRAKVTRAILHPVADRRHVRETVFIGQGSAA